MISSHSTVVDDGEEDRAEEVEGRDGRVAAGRAGVGSALVAAGFVLMGRGALAGAGACLCESRSLHNDQNKETMSWLWAL
jgi:hypothetical protein